MQISKKTFEHDLLINVIITSKTLSNSRYHPPIFLRRFGPQNLYRGCGCQFNQPHVNTRTNITFCSCLYCLWSLLSCPLDCASPYEPRASICVSSSRSPLLGFHRSSSCFFLFSFLLVLFFVFVVSFRVSQVKSKLGTQAKPVGRDRAQRSVITRTRARERTLTLTQSLFKAAFRRYLPPCTQPP